MPRFLIAVSLVAILYPRSAEACDCSSSPICHSLWAASAVFLATADRVTTPSPGTEDVRLVIDELLRGEGIGRTIALRQSGLGGSCDYDFTRGGRYLVFASKLTNGTWQVLVCGGTRRLDDSLTAVDVSYIRRVLASPGAGSITGKVLAAKVPGEHSTASTVRRDVLVTLRSPAGDLSSRTDASGDFRFDRVNPGRYAVTTSIRRLTTVVPSASFSIGAEACLALRVVTDP